ncbi:MoaB/Mog domain-containing protein [Desarmillaria tabescens]|uniref:MoaB/Mog domain-containing protein n=1 Tax=Armillaria tabescens TaxID=1929756 RepID=A0AA39U252_ARMTA|nr:MoaB/Mog domain-containing protein [Desarmillaria tabescens]KAK0469184.1 MoaB/Mog domain-containing protein [Desarmillaria tabescens]
MLPVPFRIPASSPFRQAYKSILGKGPRVLPCTRQSRHFIAVMPARESNNTPPKVDFGFELSPMPTNPLGEGKCIRTAAALIIGDEILNGKTLEANSHFFAKYCFEHGIELKRIEVIADDEAEIIEASQRMVKNYDFVVTSGGIGPTHDDITYASLAKAFGQGLAHHTETLRRLDEMNKHRPWISSQTKLQREATQRMALFPERAEVIFVGSDIWVPVVRLEGKLCIFPGIPKLFQIMLTQLTQFLPLPPPSERPLRIQIFTDRPESMIAPYLTTLQARLKSCGIRVGSYPVLGIGVFVSLIGRPVFNSPECITNVVKEVEREIGGKIYNEKQVAEKKKEGAISPLVGSRAVTATNFTCTTSPIKAKI